MKRGRRDWFTEKEREIIRQRHAAGVKPDFVARELNCSIRTIHTHYAKLKAGRPETIWEARARIRRRKAVLAAKAAQQQKPKRSYEKRVVKATGPETPPRKSAEQLRAARFYRGNFDL